MGGTTVACPGGWHGLCVARTRSGRQHPCTGIGRCVADEGPGNVGSGLARFRAPRRHPAPPRAENGFLPATAGRGAPGRQQALLLLHLLQPHPPPLHQSGPHLQRIVLGGHIVLAMRQLHMAPRQVRPPVVPHCSRRGASPPDVAAADPRSAPDSGSSRRTIGAHARNAGKPSRAARTMRQRPGKGPAGQRSNQALRLFPIVQLFLSCHALPRQAQAHRA